MSHLDSTVSDSHPQREALLVIFHRKLKRAKINTSNEEEDDNSDEDDMDDDDLDSDDGSNQEICPPGCDQALYDEVCGLSYSRASALVYECKACSTGALQ
jgi:cilia- and flagella-associated protein 44